MRQKENLREFPKEEMKIARKEHSQNQFKLMNGKPIQTSLPVPLTTKRQQKGNNSSSSRRRRRTFFLLLRCDPLGLRRRANGAKVRKRIQKWPEEAGGCFSFGDDKHTKKCMIGVGQSIFHSKSIVKCVGEYRGYSVTNQKTRPKHTRK